MVNNMTRIPSINANTTNPSMTAQQRKEKSEQVAAGVGGAAGLTTSATKMAGKRGLQAEQSLSNMLGTVTKTQQAVNKNSKAVTGLWGTFKNNIKVYSADIFARLNKLKDAKFIGPIIKSPFTKKVAGFFGGALAFFVLITGVNTAVKTGEIAVDDFKHQLNEMRNAA